MANELVTINGELGFEQLLKAPPKPDPFLRAIASRSCRPDDAGLTQEQVAGALNVTTLTLRSRETGRETNHMGRKTRDLRELLSLWTITSSLPKR